MKVSNLMAKISNFMKISKFNCKIRKFKGDLGNFNGADRVFYEMADINISKYKRTHFRSDILWKYGSQK